MKPAFAVLNKLSISFFDGENVHSLIDSFPLKEVEVKKDPLWTRSNCIPMYDCEGKGGNKIGKNLEKVFCVETTAQANEWMQAIEEFHRCTLEQQGESEEASNKLKSKIKRKGMASDEQIEESRKKELLASEQEANNQIIGERDEEKKQMDQMMRKIMEQYRQHKEIERKRREEMRIQRIKMREKNKRLGSLAKCVESALEVKAMQDQLTLDSLLKDTKSLHERNLLKDAQSKMQALWDENDSEASQQENDLKKAQEQVYDKMKKELIQEAADWTKDLDPADCYKDALTGGNLPEMKKVCSNTVEYGAVPDLKKLLNCLNKKSFCNTCCSYYIGAAKETDKVRCVKQCDLIINSDSNAYLVKYGVGTRSIVPPTPTR